MLINLLIICQICYLIRLKLRDGCEIPYLKSQDKGRVFKST